MCGRGFLGGMNGHLFNWLSAILTFSRQALNTLALAVWELTYTWTGHGLRIPKMDLLIFRFYQWLWSGWNVAYMHGIHIHIDCIYIYNQIHIHIYTCKYILHMLICFYGADHVFWSCHSLWWNEDSMQPQQPAPNQMNPQMTQMSMNHQWGWQTHLGRGEIWGLWMIMVSKKWQHRSPIEHGHSNVFRARLVRRYRWSNSPATDSWQSMCFTRSCSHHAAIGSDVEIGEDHPKGLYKRVEIFHARGTKGGISLLDSVKPAFFWNRTWTFDPPHETGICHVSRGLIFLPKPESSRSPSSSSVIFWRQCAGPDIGTFWSQEDGCWARFRSFRLSS